MATRIKLPDTAFSLSGGPRKRPREKDEGHLQFLRGLFCVVTGAPAEAAHIRMGSLMHGKRETGAGERPSDKWAVPLSPAEHRLYNDSQHNMGERKYWEAKSIDPIVIAALLWTVTGDQEAGEMICRNARRIAPWNKEKLV